MLEHVHENLIGHTERGEHKHDLLVEVRRGELRHTTNLKTFAPRREFLLTWTYLNDLTFQIGIAGKYTFCSA
jgi:hypothetical protein